MWKEQKLVYVMSTNTHPRHTATVQWKDRNGTVNTVVCPQNVVHYNQFMGGVDHADQLRNYYRVRCRSRKFYRYLFCFVFDCAVVNTFIVWKHYQPIASFPGLRRKREAWYTLHGCLCACVKNSHIFPVYHIVNARSEYSGERIRRSQTCVNKFAG